MNSEKDFEYYQIEIRRFLDTIPIIDTHEHYCGKATKIADIFTLAGGGYYRQDYTSACGEEISLRGTLEERCERFLTGYRKSCFTSYAKCGQISLKKCWNIDEINLNTIRHLESTISEKRTDTLLDQWQKNNNIKLFIYNTLGIDRFLDVLDGKEACAPYAKLVLPIAEVHGIKSTKDIVRMERFSNRPFGCLDDYLQAVSNLFEAAVKFGIIGLKEGAAYQRTIAFDVVPKHEAATLFARLLCLSENRQQLFDFKRLDDYLFHYMMELAQSYHLPVQVHTGHLACAYNNIENGNVAKFLPILEKYKAIKFDIFHGSWPYIGEFLFTGKNYPNVALNLCWVHTIDPLYSIEMIKRLVMTVPHSKIFAFGGDNILVEHTTGALVQCKENMAYAFGQLIESGRLSIDAAKQICIDWLFNNPNEFYHLGFQPIHFTEYIKTL